MGTGEKKAEVLMIASVASMISQFNMQNIRLMQELGYKVHVACNFQDGNTCDAAQIGRFQNRLDAMGVERHSWDCPRKLFPAGKCFAAYRQLCRLLEEHPFAWLHCHSPIGGALARIAAHRAGIPVIYTAHGFHFYKGAPLKNWLLYYTAEKLLAHWTDVLITVNREDLRLARRKLQAGKVCYIPGVGIDAGWRQIQEKTKSDSRNGMREALRTQFCGKYRIPPNAVVLLSVGELSRRKNHRVVIRALAKMERKDVYYVICGQGPLHDELIREAQRCGVINRVVLAGYQSCMEEFYLHADIFVLPSVQEGLPMALMEAMATGLPCVVSDIRGNRELIQSMRFSPKRVHQLQEVLELLTQDVPLCMECGQRNQKKICAYDIRIVEKRMRKIYAAMKENPD